MKFSQIPRKPLRPEEEIFPEPQKMWEPTWKCFCCQDTGKVQLHLVRKVIPDYDDNRDCIPICQNSTCSAGPQWLHLPINCLDTRLSADICKELDSFHRDDWLKTRHDWYLQVQAKVRELASEKSLRRSDGTTTKKLSYLEN